jgi:choline dehydrogenase-like flavoprotein
MEGFMDDYYYGRRPTAIMMPNFRNVKKQEMDFLRGYMTFYSAGRGGWGNARNEDFGPGFKEANSEVGPWRVFMMMQGETIPKAENRVYLDEDLKDKWGIPQLRVDVGYDNNDELSVQDFLNQGAEMLEKAGCKDIRRNDSGQAPGLDIHEMGGVRMGRDPETSLLGKYHQMHACPNVYVTDGASMTSTGTQNPSLTYMAFTARAVDHAVKALKRKDI